MTTRDELPGSPGPHVGVDEPGRHLPHPSGRYESRPRLAASDEAIGLFRRWARQS